LGPTETKKTARWGWKKRGPMFWVQMVSGLTHTEAGTGRSVEKDQGPCRGEGLFLLLWGEKEGRDYTSPVPLCKRAPCIGGSSRKVGPQEGGGSWDGAATIGMGGGGQKGKRWELAKCDCNHLMKRDWGGTPPNGGGGGGWNGLSS